MMATKKILVVDDSPFMRTIISDLILEDSTFVVVGTASNGVEAVEQVKQLNPDAVTMDVEMPIRNGIDALRQIMSECPAPTIMLSGLTEEGRQETLAALEYGAFDFVCKPSPSGGQQDIHKVGMMLREKLHAAIVSDVRRKQLNSMAEERRISEQQRSEKPSTPPSIGQDARLLKMTRSEANVGNNVSERLDSKRLRPHTSSELVDKQKKEVQSTSKDDTSILRKQTSSISKPLDETVSIRKLPDKKRYAVDQHRAPSEHQSSRFNMSKRMSNNTNYSQLVAVGTSTGGPRALKELLSNLPGDLPAPVLIVQHMPPNFTHSLAQRLNTYSELHVKEAEHGDVLQSGWAYLAPGGQHMTVVARPDGTHVIELSVTAPRSGHRPSVDVLFESLLPFDGFERHILLLTGMGSDGARSMNTLYQNGVTSTFAESEQSCIVYGMPRSAIELNCVTHVVPIQDMARQLVKAMK
ncbi:protein-glutamate methylesterase/protein-glutamine glutaminase [Paenibacillus arenosi]|nr:chemotaxis response regulator protein-glutamate methylesterase [Paenibacillus arenosi]